MLISKSYSKYVSVHIIEFLFPRRRRDVQNSLRGFPNCCNKNIHSFKSMEVLFQKFERNLLSCGVVINKKMSPQLKLTFKNWFACCRPSYLFIQRNQKLSLRSELHAGNWYKLLMRCSTWEVNNRVHLVMVNTENKCYCPTIEEFDIFLTKWM